MMSLLWALIFLAVFNFKLSNCNNDQNSLPTAAAVFGTVYCDTCFQQNFPKPYHYIPGASVAVECYDNAGSILTFRQEARTNKHGRFKVHLPFGVTEDVDKINGCSVKLISSTEPSCAVAAAATCTSLKLKLRKEGTQVFSAGFLAFRPEIQPEVCDQRQIIKNVETQTDYDGKSPVLNHPRPRRIEEQNVAADPSSKLVTPNPLIPTLPNPFNLPGAFPLNPSLFPPLIPSPPLSLFPPLFPSSPPPSFPFPLIPGLIPPTPPSPSFPFPTIPGLTPTTPPSPSFPFPTIPGLTPPTPPSPSFPFPTIPGLTPPTPPSPSLTFPPIFNLPPIPGIPGLPTPPAVVASTP